MIVTSIEPKRKYKMQVSLDGEPAFILSNKELASLSIREGDELDEAQTEALMHTVGRMAARLAMELLIRRDYSKVELQKKLHEKGYSDWFVDYAINYVDSYHYLDDTRYARQHILSKQGMMSRKMLVWKIKQKGVDGDIIEEILEQEGWNDEEGILYEIHKKYGSAAKLSEKSEKDIEKFCLSLIRKGYQYADIRRILKNGEIEEL